jgi:hypothetical protein
MRKVPITGMAAGAALLIIMGGGCAATPVAPSSSAIKVEQAPITDHMRSRVGTADELSPIAPPEARKVRKVGNRWTCEVEGRPMIYNDAASRWEPQGQ